MALNKEDRDEIETMTRDIMKRELQITMRKVLTVIDSSLKWPARAVFASIKEGFYQAGLTGELPGGSEKKAKDKKEKE